MKKLRVGIIGVGNIGSAHTRSIYSGEIEQMTLAALCDIDEEKRKTLSEKYPNVPIFCTSDELIESGLCEAVIIATPHRFHPPIAVKAFENGLHVLSEKPAGVDCKSASEMQKTAEKSGKIYGIMFNQRANKLFGKAKQIVKSGELGELKRCVWIITNWYRKQCYYDSGNWRATWAGEGGGVLLNQAPHNLDLWQWICGMPIAVRAECPIGKFHDIEVEDEATVFAEYENGASGVFITSTGDFPGTNRLEITGTKGKLILENNTLTHFSFAMDERDFCLTEYDAENPVTVTIIEDEPCNGHTEILKNFASAVLNGTPLLAPGSEALNELMISNAAYLSSWTGEKVRLPIDSEKFLLLLEKRKKTSVYKETKTPEAINDTYKKRWNTNW